MKYSGDVIKLLRDSFILTHPIVRREVDRFFIDSNIIMQKYHFLCHALFHISNHFNSIEIDIMTIFMKYTHCLKPVSFLYQNYKRGTRDLIVDCNCFEFIHVQIIHLMPP